MIQNNDHDIASSFILSVHSWQSMRSFVYELWANQQAINKSSVHMHADVALDEQKQKSPRTQKKKMKERIKHLINSYANKKDKKGMLSLMTTLFS